MDNLIKCCAYCGNERLGVYPKMTICSVCHDKTLPLNKKKTVIFTSQKPKEYYRNKSIKKYADDSKWKDLFVCEELSLNPLFDADKYKIYCIEENKRLNRKTNIESNPKDFKPYTPPKHQPKCPTCSSTNIKKLTVLNRAAHGYAFGLFSKTARSQFCCLNCGYKW